MPNSQSTLRKKSTRSANSKLHLSTICSLLHINTPLPLIKLTKLINMKKSQPGSSVVLLVLTFSFSVSWATLSSPGSGELISCLQSNSNNVTTISQLIFTPVNSSFQPIWQVAVQNTRFLKPSTPKPSVIVTPVEETLIQTSLYCAKKHGYEIRIRSGGHDYEGLSYTADVPFVMLDFTNMRSIDCTFCRFLFPAMYDLHANEDLI
ncbi:hypothetical protein L2E82_35638 [Cichorium intybus]|uniref:Uncharacterized protein n=1 Tax=Cichorium intybus TaxID=13427 RepID=A0ACB9BPG3_CICIN|nr:hypothetical protein L2E82_35638 [Cichorium intybus]